MSDFEFYSRSYWATWARTLSCFLPFQTSLELCPNMYSVTMILGASIYLYKSLCLICKLLRQDLSLKTIIQIILDTIKEGLHHSQSTICHLHIVLRMLQSSHSLSCKYKILHKFV